MKTVFRTEEIPHLWAHKQAKEGRAPSNLSFDGATIFSYSTAIARHIEHKGKSAIVINDRSFSNSTTKHQGMMRRAIPSGIPLFYIAESRGARLSQGGLELFNYAVESAATAAQGANATRQGTQKRASLEAQQCTWLERAKQVSDFFGLRRKVDEKTITRLAITRATAEKKAEKERKAKEEAQRIKYATAFESWLAGGNAEYNPAHNLSDDYFPAHNFPVAFRVESEELVSTLGARVPLNDARRAYRFAVSKRGQAWRENGETCPVGGYALNAISENGIVAGCHRITWAEIERLAPVLA